MRFMHILEQKTRKKVREMFAKVLKVRKIVRTNFYEPYEPLRTGFVKVSCQVRKVRKVRSNTDTCK